nr:hypothetical protein [uncultured Rhodoferax sp.]
MDLFTTAVRQLVLFAHTLVFAFAIVAVFREDVALLTSRRINSRQLKVTGRTMAWLLGLLWLTGGALILLEPSMTWEGLFAKPKLMAKLTVVSLLTLNGLLLHWIVFPMLTQPQRRPDFASLVCVIVGTVSSVSWVFASFVGVARLIAPAMSYIHFLTLYLVSLSIGMVVGLSFVRLRIRGLMVPA